MTKVTFTREQLTQRGYTIYSFGLACGMPWGSLNNVLIGRSLPSLKTARKIALALQIPLDELTFTGETENEAASL